MGQPELAEDPRFRDPLDRSRNHEEIDEIIGRWTAGRDLEALERDLHAAGVPATRIFTIADIFRDAHYRARGAIVHAPDAELGSVAMAAPVPRLSETPGRVVHAGRRVGQDTRRVLAEVAGCSEEEIDRLQRAGVIHADERRGDGETDVVDERAGAA
jgi:crotonobetainyl-CoA:carnitine CoA-transferase CaiB-like acyl-CoA transferase